MKFPALKFPIFKIQIKMYQMIIARSAIYVHRRSLLLVPTTPPPHPTTPTPPGFPRVIGLIIIGETVACTLRVIFCGDFKVPKNPEKKCV